MDERRLIRQILQGDIDAFETLAGGYQSKIFALCLRILKNEQDALDAVQESLIKIYKNLDKFKFRSSFSTWIYTITKNTAFDAFRRKKNDVSFDDISEFTWSEQTSYGLEDSVVDAETRGSIYRMINELRHDQRSVIILKDIDGYSYEEISVILDIPIGTVRSRLSRAREKLRAALKAEGLIET
jgi:RNA polymerase sigma-70 factor (ECF subfamily)